MSLRGRTLALLGLLVLLCLPAIQPYLWGDVPRTNDLPFHLYRAVALDRLVRAGVLFPRWTPHLVHGYGYPVLNYFPYLSHYLVVLIHFTGVGFLWSYRLAAALSLVGAAWGAFLLGRELFGERAGLLAGIAYAYSPYLLYTAHVRGGLPESVALALLPCTLLAVRRAALGELRYVALAGLTFAGYVFSHNAMSLQAAPLLLAFGLWSGRGRFWRGTGLTGASLGLGLGLAAFYWLPALGELQDAQFEQGVQSAAIAYSHNFSPLTDLLARPALPIDSDLLNPAVTRPLPVAALALAGLALLAGLRRPGQHADRLSLGLLLLATTLITLPVSRPLWDAVPLLQRTLWPWRFLGPASLFAALLAGSLSLAHLTHQGLRSGTRGLRGQPPPPPATLITLFLAALFLANGLPWTYPPREPVPDPASSADLTRFELPPLLIGTTTAAEFLPRWVAELPDTAAQRDALLVDPDPDRLDRTRLPPGAAAQHKTNALLHDEYRITLLAPASLTFRHFYFPGWRATLDGEPLAIRVTAPHGLMAVEVPGGDHTLLLRFGSTPLRSLADLGSGLALATALGLLVWTAGRASGRQPRLARLVEAFSLLPFLLLALFVVSFKVSYLDRVDNPLRQHGLAPENRPTAMEQTLGADLLGELWLHGYSLRDESIAADGETALDLYWQAQRPLGVVYGFNLRLRDDQGRIWNSPETVRPRDWRFIPGTDFWPPDQYILDSYIVRPLPGTPPGDYRLEVVVFRLDTLAPLGTASIGPLQIAHPDRSSYASTSPRATFLDGELALLDLTFDRVAAAPGDPVRVDAVWRALAPPEGQPDYALTLALVAPAPNGRHVAAFEFPLGGSYPTSRWARGDVLHDQYLFRLPADLPAGLHEWRLLLTRPGGDVVADYHPRPAATLHVAALERRLSPPPLDGRLDVTLDGQVRLVGYDLAADVLRPGDSLNVALVWQARTALDTPYRVFVHMLDSAGQLVAQSDAEPAGWTRPTTGWTTAEYVLDRHTLQLAADLPPGRYGLRAGLYDPASGARLTAADYPDGSVPLADVTLAQP